MIYRKAPPTPTRLLLRVVAAAGAGALLTIGCSSSSTVAGSVVETPSDASDTDTGPILTGSVANPDGSLPCGTGVCGVAPYYPDAGDAGDADASLACGTGVCGTVAHVPDASDAASDASDDASGPGCHPCGVVIRPDN